MFDVTTGRLINYGQDLSVTVFQDRTDKQMWYIVPVPMLRQQSGLPAFSFTKYKMNEGDAGVCYFEVELTVPDAAREAVKRELGGDVKWGQFTWIDGQAFFEFDLTVDDKLVPTTISQPPSLFGSNVAAFQLELASDADVRSFGEALQGVGASPFRVKYDMTVLTQLLAGRATVSYSASAAISYQRKYVTTVDKWGHRKTILAETSQLLKESGAGKVDVTFGPNVTDEVRQLIYDWGWSTLEKQVATAVDAAKAMAQGTDGPVSATSDFTATYSEDSTVPWTTPVSSFLPRFDPETWKKIAKEVDNRELVVTFQLVGNPKGNGQDLFTDVEVEILAPTSARFVLSPGGAAPVAAFTYTAPGRSGSFDPKYRYKYKVSYPGGQPPYESPEIEDTAALVNLRPDQFGIRNVTFVGLNVPFPDVATVLIDYYDNPPPGHEPKLQTKDMTENGVEVNFLSTYHTLLTNSYAFRLRYVMANNSVVVVEPGPAFGADNANVVNVMDPASNSINFTLRAIITGKSDGFASIDVTADYKDPQNPIGGPQGPHSWAGWVPNEDNKRGVYSAPDWRFQANPSEQSANFKSSGTILYGNFDQFDFKDLVIGYRSKPLMLRDDEEVYSVLIDGRQIDWTQIETVQVNVFQMVGESGTVSAVAQAPTAAFLVPHQLRSEREEREVAGQTTGLLSYSLFAPGEKVENFPFFYTLRRPRNAQQLVFYYNATYVYKDKSKPAGLAKAEVKDSQFLLLPALPPPTSTDQIQCVVLERASR